MGSREAGVSGDGVEIFTENLDHFGLLASAIKDLGLVEIIDKLLPMDTRGNSILSMGQRVCGMIMNGLGFIGTRLYMTEDFFKSKPVELLFGEGIRAEHFNDDALGRCLDEIYQYGPTKFLSQVAIPIAQKKGLLGRTIHHDTTTLSVYMEREEGVLATETGADLEQIMNQILEQSLGQPLGQIDQEISEKPQGDGYVPPELTCAKPAHGYAKNKRMDLRQMVLELGVTGEANFPIWAEAHSGNTSDKVILQDAAQRVQAFCKDLEASMPPLLHVADSAAYESFLEKGDNLLWISRVPETHGKARDLIQKADAEIAWVELDENYKIMAQTLSYRDVDQRWILVFSQAAFERECKTMERGIAKEKAQMTTALNGLCHRHFGCEKDARDALEKLERKMKYHTISEISIHTEMKYPGKGKPKQDAEKVIDYVQIKTELLDSAEKIKSHKRMKGRFILATNQLDQTALPDADILPEYKGQYKAEGSFKFIKSDSFEVSKIFLKKDSRINALMIVMVLCLMVYNYVQYFLRKKLIEKNETIPSQVKKPIQNPTAEYIFRLFQGICVAVCKINGQCYRQITRMTDVVKKIVKLFGEFACQIYGLSTA